MGYFDLVSAVASLLPQPARIKVSFGSTQRVFERQQLAVAFTASAVALASYSVYRLLHVPKSTPRNRNPGSVTRFKAAVGELIAPLIPVPVPSVVKEFGGSADQIALVAKEQGITKALVVTDDVLVKLGLLDPTLKALQGSIEVVIFDKVVPDPTIDNAVEGLQVYLQQNCDGIIAFGGGSSMDCAKVIGALAADPKKAPKDLMGYFTLVGKRVPPLIAIPTTAGTGSEATLAAVITFPEEKKKKFLVDPQIVPKVAILDAQLLMNLPPHITAATGMDALTHAVESYVGRWRTKYTGDYSLRATEKIYAHLCETFTNGRNQEARKQMLLAAFEAGVAFTRASVGYVHAIAHQLGALFHVPHGIANAMVLPHVLEYYRDACTVSYAELAVAAGLGNLDEDKEVLADRFVSSIHRLNEKLNIPKVVSGMKEEHVQEVARRALAEAHGNAVPFHESPLTFLLDLGMPVPKYMAKEDCESLLRKLLTVEN